MSRARRTPLTRSRRTTTHHRDAAARRCSPGQPSSSSWWPGFVLALVAAVDTLRGGGTGSTTRPPRRPGRPPPRPPRRPATKIAVKRVTGFDPEGDGEENDEQLRAGRRRPPLHGLDHELLQRPVRAGRPQGRGRAAARPRQEAARRVRDGLDGRRVHRPAVCARPTAGRQLGRRLRHRAQGGRRRRAGRAAAAPRRGADRALPAGVAHLAAASTATSTAAGSPR